MTDTFDILVRDAYLQSDDELRDIGIEDGRIERVAGTVEADADAEIDAEGMLVSPGFVDSHVHLDQALSLGDERIPEHNGEFNMADSLARADEHFRSTDRASIEETVVEVCRRAVANGVLHVRTHAYVDSDVGTKSVEAVQSARERVSDHLDLQVVAFPQQGIHAEGTETALRESIDAGADILGGLDPGSLNDDIPGTLETWFGLAADLDVDLDVHLHDAGTLGLHTVGRLLEWIDDYGYQGRVTASHSYALADAARSDGDTWLAGESLDNFLDRLSEAGLAITTCYLSTKPGMPVIELQDAGVALGHGSDQVRDMWSPHGNIDPIEEALIQSLILGIDRDFTANANLGRIWAMLTTGGASVLGIEDGYGIETGTPADLVVHDSWSRQRAIIEQGTPRVVIKDGSVVARDGSLVD